MTTQPPTNPKQPDPDAAFACDCQRYFDGQLSEQAFKALQDTLYRDGRRLSMFVESAMHHEMVAEALNAEQADHSISQLLGEHALGTGQNKDAETVADLIAQANEAFNKRTIQLDQSITTRQVFSLTGYLLKRGLVRSRGAIAGVAAVLLLALTLVLVFRGGPEPTGPTNIAGPIVEKPRQDAATPPQTMAVATLTASHDAQWVGPASAGLTTGDHLHAGQRLTLSAGFAEITTNDGAIAILEAPCTVELLDNNNALRLHAGKLVGICETDASKGFLVRTPHMDVIDLGTRFGVDVLDAASTEVHVLEGEVQAIRANANYREPITLTAGQALKADAQQMERVAVDTARFVPDPSVEALRPRFEGAETTWLGQLFGDVRATQQTSKALQVYLEQSGFVLSEPVAVDIDKDTPWPGKDLASQTIPAGERVDIYLLHLDTPGEYSIDDGDYTLHFDRPILGVIGHESTLRATDGSLGVANVLYSPMPTDPAKMTQAVSGIDNAGTFGKPDFVSVTKDGQSLKLRLNSSSHLDQLRVLVQAADR